MGSRILAGRYELLEKIGEGGMAVVFKARDRLLNRMVAIKILKPEYTKDLVFIESFRRESQTAASLVHPNIVNVYDVGKEGNIYYIVMELIDGQPLSQLIKDKGALDPRQAATIARQVASALSMAHKHQLIHRDVKPHNIMLTSEGVAKITDFGIAKALTTETLVGEHKEAVMGSVHYFSPEQARGGYVDEKSDIYSLGIVLYEMLTGQVPFDGESAVAVAVKHMNEPMVPPSQINPGIPQDLEDIVMKATDKLQINRYKNADEMITALNFVKFSKPASATAADSERSERAERTEKSGLFHRHTDSGHVGDERDVDEDGQGGRTSEKTKKKVKLNPVKLIAVILAIVLAIPVSGFIYKAISKEGGQTETIKVPSVVGLTEQEAKDALSAVGLKLEIDMELPSDIYKEGEVMSQSPTAEATVKSGQTVKVNISKGLVDGTVPAVEGKPLSGAKYLIESYGYKVGKTTEAFSDDVPEGVVISQKPDKGTTLADGKSVELVVSKGPENPSVDSVDFRNKPFADVEAQMAELGLSMGAITYSFNASVPEGNVISHNPGPGVELKEGDLIDFVVSKGTGQQPVDPTTPDAEGGGVSGAVAITVDYSKAVNEVFYLTVNVSDGVESPRTPISRQERSKTDGSETINVTGAGKNGKVLVFFDNELVYELNVDFTTGQIL